MVYTGNREWPPYSSTYVDHVELIKLPRDSETIEGDGNKIINNRGGGEGRPLAKTAPKQCTPRQILVVLVQFVPYCSPLLSSPLSRANSLHHALAYHAIPRYVMSCHAISRHITSRYAMLPDKSSLRPGRDFCPKTPVVS